MVKIRVFNGPNLNLLGTREPGLYGTRTLKEINDDVRARAGDLGVEIKEDFQSNSEA